MGLLNVCAMALLLWGSTAHAAESVNNDDDRLYKKIADLKAGGALIEPLRKEIAEGHALIESLYKKIADLKADGGTPVGMTGEAPQWGPWSPLDDQGRRVLSIDTCAAGEFTVTTCDVCPPGQFTDAFTAAAAACSACPAQAVGRRRRVIFP